MLYNKDYSIFGVNEDKIVNTRINDEQLSYNVYVVPNNENTNWIFERLMDWFSKVSGIKRNTAQKIPHFTLQKYSIGDRFHRHIDLTESHPNRRYNIGVQLNNEYEGGEYVFWDSNENEGMFSKEVGNALAYNCKVPHEIKKITNGERWSLVMPIAHWHLLETKNLI